jgi:thiol:disulfide interchange protein DsbA
MMVSRPYLAPIAFVLALALGACSSEAPAPAPASAPAPATATPATEPAAAPATPSQEPASVAEGVAQSTAQAESPAVAAEPAAPPPPAPPLASEPPAVPTGPEPREGIDYVVIDPPAPFAATPGKIEVAEAFAYYCIHCAHLQELITPWKQSLPADVEFHYVPMAEGQSEALARAFYAAEAMGEHERTHARMFQFAAVERRLKQGSADEVAGLFAELGVDRAALLSTMKSFAINAQIARNRKAVRSWAIESTPTMVVNGRYKASVTQDRGHAGLLSTVQHLVARERARLAGTATSP